MILEDILTIPPNWDSPPVLERIWKTGIQTSIKGLEVRSALYTYPQKKLSFELNGLSAAESAFIRRVLWGGIHKVIGVPFWMDRTYLTAQATSGTNILQVADTSNRNFEVGAPCLIMTGYNSYEYHEISAIGSNSITLDTNLTSTWTSGSVYPVLQGRFQPQQSLRSLTSAFTEFSVQVEEAFDEDVTKVFIGEDPFFQYLGRPVFELMPNWRESLDQSINRPYDIWKYLGKETTDYSYEESVIGTRATFTFYNREDLYEFIKFFDWCRGRWGRFYCPTWNKDVVVTSAVSSSDTVISIEDIEWSTYWDVGYGVGPAGSNLFFYAPDGTKVARNISSAPSSQSLQLGSSIGFNCSAGALGMLLVSFLPLSRFATDSIRIKHLTENVAEIDVTFVAIPAVSSWSSSSRSSSSSSSRSSSSSSLSSSSSSSRSSSSSSRSSSSSSSSSRSSSSSSSSRSSSSRSSSSSSRSSSSRSSSSSSFSVSSSSSSYSAIPKAWYSYFDTSYWTVSSGSWNAGTGEYDSTTGVTWRELWLEPSYGWNVGLYPEKVRITLYVDGYTDELSDLYVDCRNNGSFHSVVSETPYGTGVEANFDWVGYESWTLWSIYCDRRDYDFHVTNIEYYH